MCHKARIVRYIILVFLVCIRTACTGHAHVTFPYILMSVTFPCILMSVTFPYIPMGGWAVYIRSFRRLYLPFIYHCACAYRSHTAYMYTRMHAYAHAVYIRTHIHVHTYMHMQYTRIHAYTRTHAHTRSHIECTHTKFT